MTSFVKYSRYLVLWLFLTGTCLMAQPMGEDLTKMQFTSEIKGDSLFLKSVDHTYALRLKIERCIDFNDDMLHDIIAIDPLSCGNWGDCIYIFLLQLPDTSYECIFSDYLYRFEIAERLRGAGRGKWIKFDVYRRPDTFKNSDSYSLTPEGILEFNGTIYHLKR